MLMMLRLAIRGARDKSRVDFAVHVKDGDERAPAARPSLRGVRAGRRGRARGDRDAAARRLAKLASRGLPPLEASLKPKPGKNPMITLKTLMTVHQASRN